MAIRKILTEPHPLLHQVSEEVQEIDDALRTLLDDMLETMYAHEGIGLAAPQIGVLKRLVVIDLREARRGAQDDPLAFPLKMVNPRILWASEQRQSFSEGCLSVPSHYVDVERPAKIRVSWRDENGLEREQTASGLLSICIQHEIDHLNGVTLLTHEAADAQKQLMDVVLRS